MNFILAVLLFAIIFFLVGVPTPGAEVGAVIPGSPADNAGIKPGDKIMAIEDVKVKTWEEMIEQIAPRAERETKIMLTRNTRNISIELTPERTPEGDRGVIGIQRAMKAHRPLASLYYGARQTLGTTIFIISRVVEMVIQRQPTDVAGPVGIVQVVGEVARTGFINLLTLAAILSVNLGLFNFPHSFHWMRTTSADNGKVLGQGWVRSRKEPSSQSGASVAGILVLATYQDLKR